MRNPSRTEYKGVKHVYLLFFLNSGFPFLTDATNMSPTPASGRRLRCEPVPKGSITKRDLAPLLSAQLRTAPVGRPMVILNLLPEAPEPVNTRCSLEMPSQTWGCQDTRKNDTNLEISKYIFVRYIRMDGRTHLLTAFRHFCWRS